MSDNNNNDTTHWKCQCGAPLGKVVRGSDKSEKLVIDTDQYPGLIITLELGTIEHKADKREREWSLNQRGYERLMESIQRRKGNKKSVV